MYLSNHMSTSNQLDIPKGSPRGPLTPWDPLPPESTPSDPSTVLLASLNSSDHLNCLSNHQKTHQVSLLILWDILPLPLDPLGPSRPTPGPTWTL